MVGEVDHLDEEPELAALGGPPAGLRDYREREIGRQGFYLFDLVAAGYVVGPDVVRCAAPRDLAEQGATGW